MTTTKPLSITTGQKWRTVTGRTVRIDSESGMHGYHFSASYYGTKSGSTYFTADGVSIGRDDLQELIADAPEAKVEAPVVDVYLERCIDDEMTLASLLGWKNFTRPSGDSKSAWMFGTHAGVHGHTTRNGSVPMPAWRRDWHSAGQLVGRCGLCIQITDAGVAVHTELTPVFRAIFTEHPSIDSAIFHAMCKAAIAHLRAEVENSESNRSTSEAQRPVMR